MKYKNAAEILPERLLTELQAYVKGEMLYVPNTGRRKKWGSGNGMKYYYEERNREIREAFRKKISIKELSEQYGLAESTIRKIIY